MSDTRPPPPPGTNYLDDIEPAVTFSLLGAFFTGLLLPPCIFLIFFTKPLARRQPVFIMNVAIVILGLTMTGINIGQEWMALVLPTKPIPRPLILANITLNTFPPLIIDSVLIFRLLAFYPKIITPPLKRIMVLIFPAIVKSARLVAIAIFLYKLGQNGAESIGALSQEVWSHNPYLATEWSLRIVDNIYSTSIFIWKLRQFSNGGKSNIFSRNKSLLARIRGIFTIALANFVFPQFMNIVQLILLIREPNYAHGGAQTVMINLYVSIFGMLFATVWASGNAWGRDQRNHSAFETSIRNDPGYIPPQSDAYSSPGARVEAGSSEPYRLSLPASHSPNAFSMNTISVENAIRVDQLVVVKTDDDLSR